MAARCPAEGHASDACVCVCVCPRHSFVRAGARNESWHRACHQSTRHRCLVAPPGALGCAHRERPPLVAVVDLAALDVVECGGCAARPCADPCAHLRTGHSAVGHGRAAVGRSPDHPADRRGGPQRPQLAPACELVLRWGSADARVPLAASDRGHRCAFLQESWEEDHHNHPDTTFAWFLRISPPLRPSWLRARHRPDLHLFIARAADSVPVMLPAPQRIRRALSACLPVLQNNARVERVVEWLQRLRQRHQLEAARMYLVPGYNRTLVQQVSAAVVSDPQLAGLTVRFQVVPPGLKLHYFGQYLAVYDVCHAADAVPPSTPVAVAVVADAPTPRAERGRLHVRLVALHQTRPASGAASTSTAAGLLPAAQRLAQELRHRRRHRHGHRRAAGTVHRTARPPQARAPTRPDASNPNTQRARSGTISRGASEHHRGISGALPRLRRRMRGRDPKIVWVSPSTQR
eukprot:ctg_1990.g419